MRLMTRMRDWLAGSEGAGVGADVGGVAMQQRWVFVEVLPREFREFVGTTTRNELLWPFLRDEAIGYECLHDAIVCVEEVAAGLLGYVEAEDLLFVFGQSLKSLTEAYQAVFLQRVVAGGGEAGGDEPGGGEGGGADEGEAQYRAVVVCKLRYAESFEQLLFWQEERGGGQGNGDSERLTWSDLKDLKQYLRKVGAHPPIP